MIAVAFLAGLSFGAIVASLYARRPRSVSGECTTVGVVRGGPTIRIEFTKLGGGLLMHAEDAKVVGEAMQRCADWALRRNGGAP